MADGLLYSPGFWSYAVAAMLFTAFSVRLGIAWRGGLRASLLLAAVVASALWAAASATAQAFPADSGWWLAARTLDVLRAAAWLAFLTLLLDGWRDGRPEGPWATTPRWLLAVGAGLIIAALVAPQAPPWRDPRASLGPAAFAALLGIAVLGLLLVEQLFRRTPEQGRWAIKPIVVGLAGMFAFDLLFFSDALLFRHPDPDIWGVRGIAHALAIPFVAVATVRNTAWTIDLHVSRGVVFHSTALLVSGGYLLVVAGAGYWVRFFGGSWGRTLEMAFVFAALLGLAAVLFSTSVRARLKVFVSKHFFSYRFDYRREWLGVTRTLASPGLGLPVEDQVVRALANLVESRGGALWVAREGAFRQTACTNLPPVSDTEPHAGSLASFLARSGWVILLDEYARSPERYPALELPGWLASLKEAWLVVPLPSGTELVGFVVLARARTPLEVNWEVLDLLKTASRQAASYLAQIRANEALLETQKFDAFNRMSAFVVHDLKNLVAQLTLLLRNAERHRSNPEFQRDALETIDHVTQRMNALMLQLRTGTTPVERPGPVDLAAVAHKQCALKGVARTSGSVEAAAGIHVLGHEDRLERVIGHLIQNALEAIGENGRVTVRVFADGLNAVAEVADDGVGMPPEFVRDKLFKPFQTTKSHGMGIGVYESFQYVTGLGGRMFVDSTPGAGTKVRVVLPREEMGSAGDAELREVA